MSKQALGFLRSTALLSMLVGAIGSLALMFYTGRQNKSILLMAAFTIWVLSPYILLWMASRMTSRLAASTLVIINWLMLVISVGLLVTYAVFFISPIAKPAAPYLMAPFIACVLSMLLILMVETRSRTKKHK